MWLSMDNEGLKNECRKYGLAISESREANFQTLYLFQGRMETRFADRNKRPNYHKQSRANDDQAEKSNKIE